MSKIESQKIISSEEESQKLISSEEEATIILKLNRMLEIISDVNKEFKDHLYINHLIKNTIELLHSKSSWSEYFNDERHKPVISDYIVEQLFFSQYEIHRKKIEMDILHINISIDELEKSFHKYITDICKEFKILFTDIFPVNTRTLTFFKKYKSIEMKEKIELYEHISQQKFKEQTSSSGQSFEGRTRYYDGKFTRYLISYLFNVDVDSEESMLVYNLYTTYINIYFIDQVQKVNAYNILIRRYIENELHRGNMKWNTHTIEYYQLQVDDFVPVDFLHDDAEAYKKNSEVHNGSKKKYFKYKQKYLQLKNKLTN